MKFEASDAELLYDFVVLDPVRHYFICHTIDAHKSYKGVWQLMDKDHIQIAVFLRHTGLLQVAMTPSLKWENYENAFFKLLEEINWQQAMVIDSVCQKIVNHFGALQVSEGAKIMRCSTSDFHDDFDKQTHDDAFEIRALDVTDLDEVVLIYQDVFTGFASKVYMTEKLIHNRGRAFGGFINGKLVAVAQSDYETKQHALIVGVATAKNFQRKGFGERIFRHLCKQLIEEKKTLYLQYDSLIAGDIYKRFGFVKVDQIYHIKKRTE